MFPPVKEIIPREVDPRIKDLLNHFSVLISECVNFGSNIFTWKKYSKIDAEVIAPPMLFRHFLDLTDSISILIKEGCADPSKLLLRGLLETYFSTLAIQVPFTEQILFMAS